MVRDALLVDDHAMALTAHPAHRDGKLALLASLPAFRRCRPRELVELGRAFESLVAEPAELVQRQQEPPSWWTLVAEGSALATVDGIPAAMLRLGDSFGQPVPRRDSRSSGITIMALTPMVLFTLDPRRWPAVLERHPALAAVAASALVSRAAPGCRPGQPGEPVPRKKRSNRPSTPAPCSVMPPSTTMV
jgi:hypothetical protein